MNLRLYLLIAALLLSYTFVGYPLLLWVRAHVRPRHVAKDDYEPSVTVLISAHNEERIITRKLDNVLKSDYPADRINIIVISDGSDDGMNELLLAYPNRRVHAICLKERVGKAAALNRGVRAATAEIVVFTDARQLLERGSIRNLVSNFADPHIGCVSGLLMVGDVTSATDLTGEHLKWRFENSIREWEGSAGSMVGALGAFYAARRSLVVEIPPGTLLDDCYVPLNIVRKGYRAAFERNARAWDDVITTPRQELARKVRTLTGNYQLLRLSPWLLTHRNPIWWEFVSHKVCRLLVPFLLAIMLAASLLDPGLPLRLFALAQVSVYLLGVVALLWPKFGDRFPPAEVARAVLVLNAATMMAFVNFVSGRYSVWPHRTASSNPGCGCETNGINQSAMRRG